MGENQKEPSALKFGKQFHKDVQDEWKREFDGTGEKFKAEAKLDDSRRRIDIRVDDQQGLVGIFEIKSSNWEKLSDSQVKRRVQEYSEQVWAYIEPELAKGNDVSPGIILLGLPADPERVTLVERLFDEEGIPVAWQDEPDDQARERHSRVT